MNEDVLACPPCRADRTIFHGWRAVKLGNGLVEAVAVPDIGGRILAYNLGPYAYLWMNHRLSGKLFSPEENRGDGSLGAWKNYGGSKTWPAPQGWDNEDQWHGPPDPVLDTGRYAVEVVETSQSEATVRMRSPEDPRTGVQIVRQLTLHQGGSHATLHLEMKNVSDRERTWSIWDVVQLDATARNADGEETHNDQAWVYVPTNPNSRFPRGYNVMFGAEDNPEWQADVRPNLLGAQYQYRAGKIGVDSPAGWVAFVNQALDFAFCQCFTYVEGATYPDGATVACWTTGLGEAIDGLDYGRDPQYNVEAEVLGPLRKMAPGEIQTFDIEWYAARCPGPIVNVTSAGCCQRPLKSEKLDHGVRLTGVFGVFSLGEVQLVWLDGAGGELSVEMAGLANPLDVLTIDLVRSIPEEADTVQLRVTDRRGQSVGFLDGVRVA